MIYFVKFRIKNTFATTRNHSNQFKSMNPHYDPLETIIRPFFSHQNVLPPTSEMRKFPTKKKEPQKIYYHAAFRDCAL